MRIGINARYLQNVHTGIHNYLLNLILNLKKIDDKNEYLLFFGSNENVPVDILGAGFDYNISKMPTTNQLQKILWAHLYLPHAIKRKNVDIFHESSFIAPLFKKCPTIITVYDLAYLYLPYAYTYRTRLYLKSLLSLSLKQSDIVIAISESTKDDIINNFPISADKIHVIYAGVDDIFRPFNDKEELEKVKKIYNIKGDFILTVSLISPRKNLISLIKAFKLLKDHNKISGQLVIVGKKGWLYKELFKEVAQSGLEEDIILCGYIPTEHLLCLYNAAATFVYPSLYEGFGLPILEAMASGCPVVASNVSSMPEVCGEAALLVDPKDIEALALAISDIVSTHSLRLALIKKGLERVNMFNWRRTAEETLTVYKKANALDRTYR